MKELRNIIFLPQWIAESLVIQKEPLSTVLDINKMRKLTSTNDLIGLVALNDSIGDLMGLDIKLAIGKGISDCWLARNKRDTQLFLENTVAPNVDANTAKEVFNRIINDKSLDHVDVDEFEAIDIDRDVSVIVLKYGFFNRNEKNHIQFELIEAILQILYIYYPHHVVANTAIGRKYLELLSSQVSL